MSYPIKPACINQVSMSQSNGILPSIHVGLLIKIRILPLFVSYRLNIIIHFLRLLDNQLPKFSQHTLISSFLLMASWVY